MTQFRGGNPYCFSENLYKSVSFIDGSMHRGTFHAMQFAKKMRYYVIKSIKITVLLLI